MHEEALIAPVVRSRRNPKFLGSCFNIRNQCDRVFNLHDGKLDRQEVNGKAAV